MGIKKLAVWLAASFSAATVVPVAPVAAATLLVDAGGRLTGATGVSVSGALYDVAFLDGTCQAVFSGCDQVSDFAFSTSAGAQAAGQALIDQVWIDGPAGQFDTRPELTLHCEDLQSCFALVPFLPLNPNQGGARFALNRSGVLPDGAFGVTFQPTTDTSSEIGVTWAKFTPVAGVIPEPQTWAMLILGFGVAGAAIRRRRGPGVAHDRLKCAAAR